MVSQKQNELIAQGKFTPMSTAEASAILNNKQFGVSRAQVIPKGGQGTRLLINCNKKSKEIVVDHSWKKSMNNFIRDSGVVEVTSNFFQSPSLFGSLVQNFSEVYEKYLPFVQQFKSGVRKVFFFVGDVLDAYENICIQKLDKILKGVVFDEDVVLVKYKKCIPTRSGAIVVNQKTAVSRGGSLEESVKQNFNSWRKSTVLCPTSFQQFHTGQLFDDVIKNNIIRIGKQLTRMDAGIPQGAVLSPFLCNLYFGNIEKQIDAQIPEVLRDSSPSMCMRRMDDFLYIGQDQFYIQKIANLLHAQLLAQGMQLNSGKLQTNVQQLISGDHVNFKKDVEQIRWCGIKINTNSLETSVDYSKYENPKSTINASTRQKPGRGLKNATLRFLLQQIHPLFLDEKINSKQKVIENVVFSGKYAAFKLDAYVQKEFNFINHDFFIKIIFFAVENALILIRNFKDDFKKRLNLEFSCPLNDDELRRNFYEGFWKGLNQRHQIYDGSKSQKNCRKQKFTVIRKLDIMRKYMKENIFNQAALNL